MIPSVHSMFILCSLLYAYFEFRVAASIMVSATAVWIGWPDPPNKLWCTRVSACWPKAEAKASTRGANSWCSISHSPLGVDVTILDEGVSPFTLDDFDERSLAIVSGDAIWFGSLRVRRFTIFHLESFWAFTLRKIVR